MKKYKLLIAPLLVVPFLASCGVGDKHAVTEQEFNDACSFKGVQYLQANLIGEVSGSTSSMNWELSPTVSHVCAEASYPSYSEKFTRKKAEGGYEQAYRYDKGDYNFAITSKNDFITPQDISVLQGFETAGLTYKSFIYDSKAGTYSATFTPPSSNSNEITSVLRFENKKLTSVANQGAISGIQTTTYAYEEKTPKYPENPGPEPVDPCFVDEGQFNEALGFEGITYAKFNVLEDDGESEAITKENAQFAPGKFHLESHNFKKGEDTFNCDIYVTKEETSNSAPSIKRYQPLYDSELFSNPYNCLAYAGDAWEIVDADATEFKTPKDYADFTGIAYSADAYNVASHVFTIGEFILQFRDGKLIMLHNSTANVTINVSYAEEDIVLPEASTPTYVVDEETWNEGLETLDERLVTFYFNFLGETSTMSVDTVSNRYRSHEFIPEGTYGVDVDTWLDLYSYYNSSDSTYYIYSNTNGAGWKFSYKTTDDDHWMDLSTFPNASFYVYSTTHGQFSDYEGPDINDEYKADKDVDEYAIVSVKFINDKIAYHRVNYPEGKSFFLKAFTKNTYFEVPTNLPEPTTK